MPGRPMGIGAALRVYRGKIKPAKPGKVAMKNSSGKKVIVSTHKKVYHRGKNRFAVSRVRNWFETQEYERSTDAYKKQVRQMQRSKKRK